MSCAACQARVEKAVQKVPGVQSCSVSLLTNSLAVEGEASEAALKEAVEKAGYGFVSGAEGEKSREEEALKYRDTKVKEALFVFPSLFSGLNDAVYGTDALFHPITESTHLSGNACAYGDASGNRGYAD